jgi:hypothetical protein
MTKAHMAVPAALTAKNNMTVELRSVANIRCSANHRILSPGVITLLCRTSDF